MQEFTITELEANQRFDKYLLKLMRRAGRGYIYKMLRKRSITLNGKKAEGSVILNKGDVVKLYMKDETIEDLRGVAPIDSKLMTDYRKAYRVLDKKLTIVYEDKNVLIINKPAGVLAQKAVETDLSCNEWLIGYMLANRMITPEELCTFKPSICNRLDKFTSGLMICGKTLLGTQTMSELIRDRRIRKYYRTIVKGSFTEKMHVKGYLKRDYGRNTVFVSDVELPESEPIETRFFPLIASENFSYIEVELVTGKHHQIRSHVASIGHPILGDYKYGDKRFNERFTFMKNQILHAYRIEFPPMNGEFYELSRANITAPEPRYLRDYKRQLEKLWQLGIHAD